MSAAPTRLNAEEESLLGSQEIHTTLLELVRAISEVTDDEREIVATVQHMLDSGRVRLTGNFRDYPVEVFKR